MTLHHLDDFEQEHNAQRLFYEFEQRIRDANCHHIGEATGGISRADVLALADTVARLRARYLRETLALARHGEGEMPESDAVHRVRALREAYDEALQGFGAVRHALKRGYFTLAD